MRRCSTNRSRRATHRGGATAVEFAVVAPLILLLFFGVIELNNLNFIKHTAANAAYEGARMAAIAGGTPQLAIDRSNELLSRFTGNMHVTQFCNMGRKMHKTVP